MDGCQDQGPFWSIQPLAALLSQAKFATEQRVSGRGAKAEDQARANDLELLLQPGSTSFDLALFRRSVLGTATLLDQGRCLTVLVR